MATGQFNYKVSGEFVDIESICEPYVYSYPQNPGLKYFYSDADSADPSPLEDRFQKAATNSWAQSISLPFTDTSGSFPNIAKKGTFPTATKHFAAVSSGNNIKIYRSDSGITIGSTTYGPSSFRNGVVPTYIGAILVGGGGGGGGRGCNKGNKSGWTAKCGGSGGGSGVLSFVIDLNQTSSSQYLQLYVGTGGAGGASGSSDSRPSTGSKGSDGNATTLQKFEPEFGYLATSFGGGGYGGVGDGNDGNGGTGGTPGSSGTLNWVFDLVSTNGSAGNHCQNGGSSAISLSRVFSNVGQSPTSFFSWSSTGYYDGSSGNDYKDAYTDGGSSYGVGGRSSTNNGTTSPGYGAGGGGNGSGNGQAGGGGIAIFYY